METVFIYGITSLCRCKYWHILNCEDTEVTPRPGKSHMLDKRAATVSSSTHCQLISEESSAFVWEDTNVILNSIEWTMIFL